MDNKKGFGRDFFLENVDEKELKISDVRVESDQLEQLRKLGLIIDKDDEESN